MVIQTGVNAGCVNQWRAKLKVYVVCTQMKFLMIILKVIISFISFVNSFTTEAVTWGVLWKKVFFKMLQNSQESTYARVSFLITLQALGLRPVALLKKRLWHRCFPVNFATFLRTPFLQNTSGRLLHVTTISNILLSNIL